MNLAIFSVSVSQRPRDPAEDYRILRAALSEALRAERMEAAVAVLKRLELADPCEPLWPHQHGHTLVLLGDVDGAREVLHRAADLYFALGFHKLRRAVLKSIDDLVQTS